MPLGHAGEAISMEPGVSPGYSFVGSQVSTEHSAFTGHREGPWEMKQKAAAGAL